MIILVIWFKYMKRSRLRNIINKSNTISNKQEVRNPFDEFKQSLPIEVDDNYRLEAAWKAYGFPKDYKTALWYGMIQPIDETNVKLPSIGYNEETDEYEYLNKGKDNETVAKDIRVWDNDVIPLVQELKLGGYVRTFNEEKDCWTYTKNSQKREQPVEDKGKQVIDSFQKGGKPKFEDWYKTVPKDKQNTEDYDLEKAYNELPFEELEEFRMNPNKHLSGNYKKPNHPTYGGYGNWINKNGQWNYYISPIQIENYPERNLNWYKNYWDNYEPESVLHWIDGTTYRRGITEFKQGGQMNVIPEVFKQGGAVIPSGSLHAHKNHMQLASEGLITPKGIPVISEENGEIQQQAEIEREEVIFDKQATTDIEKLYKKFNETDKESEKNEIAIKAGKILTDIFINNTEDNTGLIEKVAEKNNLEYNK